MKKQIHSNGVEMLRPSLNRFFTEFPPDAWSSAPAAMPSYWSLSREIRERYFIASSLLPPFKRRNRIDSGRNANDKAAVTSGIRPPTTKTDCQPKDEMSPAATNPPTAAPTEN